MEFKKILDKYIMPIQTMPYQELHAHYERKYNELNASESDTTFKTYLSSVVQELTWGLKIDESLLEKDYDDEIICRARHLGPLESLRRVLLAIAEAANYKTTNHPDWARLAGRIEVQRLKLEIPVSFNGTVTALPEIWDQAYSDFCNTHSKELEEMINPELDYEFDFFGLRTLEKSYLIKAVTNKQVLLESPQRLYVRVATLLWMPDLKKIKEYYDFQSRGLYTHASPTMFNAGLKKGPLGSCYLLSAQDDLEMIYKCLTQCAIISASAGGVGLDVTNIRHSKIGHMGKSSGIVPMLKVFDASMRYVDQGGRRKGSATIFLQPWHLDFPDFLELKRQHGKEERRARDLFYSVWNCDIFMDRVRRDETWTLFCPKYAPKLTETYGEEFEHWYEYYERELPKTRGCDTFMRQMPARQLWNELLTTQVEAGMPFMTNKDTANYTSNQKNLGLIRSSNLCQEIMEVTDGDTISSCNLASIALDEYVDLINGTPTYNHTKLGETVRAVVRSLNQVIDRTHYPLQEYIADPADPNTKKLIGPGPIKKTNLDTRPLGLGVQALADAFLKMDIAWIDKEARELNKEIFATIYYHAVDESAEMAKENGPYAGFYGSPASQGLLKPDLIAIERARKLLRKENIKSNHPDYASKSSALVSQFLEKDLSKNYDWDLLRSKVRAHGLYNSLLVALMPTASSAQIRAKNESFEPYTSNMYVRSVLSGNHVIVNRYMVADLEKLGLWNKSIVNFIIKNEGSIASLPLEIVEPSKRPQLQRIKDKCMTAFELSQRLLVDMSIDRAYYVCQSQSLNIHCKDPSFKLLTSLHFYAWENGLATGMYYLRTGAATEAIKFTVEGELDVKKPIICTDEICIACQS